jgi:hypothetical protein
MSRDDLNQELSYQRIAELHADAERYRQVRLSKRRRHSRGRRWRLGRLLWPTGVAARANGIVGQTFNPPWLAHRDPAGPARA